MSIDGFRFEGQDTTARKLRQRVTAYSEARIQSALEAGCQDMPALMAFMARRDNKMAAHIRKLGRKSAQTTDRIIKYGARR